jgi:hypothetical protein
MQRFPNPHSTPLPIKLVPTLHNATIKTTPTVEIINTTTPEITTKHPDKLINNTPIHGLFSNSSPQNINSNINSMPMRCIPTDFMVQKPILNTDSLSNNQIIFPTDYQKAPRIENKDGLNKDCHCLNEGCDTDSKRSLHDKTMPGSGRPDTPLITNNEIPLSNYQHLYTSALFSNNIPKTNLLNNPLLSMEIFKILAFQMSLVTVKNNPPITGFHELSDRPSVNVVKVNPLFMAGTNFEEISCVTGREK